MREILGACITVGGFLLFIIGILRKCVNLSRNTQSQLRAATAPTSIEGILVQIGKLADTYLMSRPLWKFNQETTRHAPSMQDDNREFIVHYHKHFNRDDSVLIRAGFIITIDISHKIKPILRLAGHPISMLIQILLGVPLILVGLMVSFGNDVGPLIFLLISAILVFTYITIGIKSPDKNKILFSIYFGCIVSSSRFNLK